MQEEPAQKEQLSDTMELALIMANPRHDANVELIGPDPVGFGEDEPNEKKHLPES